MSRFLFATMLLLMIPGLAAAQDWRKDPASTSSYNCDVVDAMVEEYGSENFLRSDSGEVGMPPCQTSCFRYFRSARAGATARLRRNGLIKRPYRGTAGIGGNGDHRGAL